MDQFTSSMEKNNILLLYAKKKKGKLTPFWGIGVDRKDRKNKIKEATNGDRYDK